MREILFKAKRIDNGEWVEGWFVKSRKERTQLNSVIFIDIESEIPECFEFYEIDETTICQYTGLTDKNGNKIWENDVVIGREGYCGNPNIPTREIMFKVEYSHCHYRWLYSSDMYEFEVIGNIFDNPELSKGGVIWTRQKN